MQFDVHPQTPYSNLGHICITRGIRCSTGPRGKFTTSQMYPVTAASGSLVHFVDELVIINLCWCSPFTMTWR
eukprot:8742646-Pyramimonas_sp.AAC.1